MRLGWWADQADIEIGAAGSKLDDSPPVPCPGRVKGVPEKISKHGAFISHDCTIGRDRGDRATDRTPVRRTGWELHAYGLIAHMQDRGGCSYE